MNKKNLLRKIKQLEDRVTVLEADRTQGITCASYPPPPSTDNVRPYELTTVCADPKGE